ncbi:MAG: hypothetical protein KDC98_16195 [Planctomycetes bacterium]|nr:hypothetical protein [Planctomycetota bacterium]
MLGLLRWFVVLLGGLILGAGMTLHGQVALARYMRDEVENTFVLWRALGRATFYFQGGETRMALAMSEVPPEALDQSDRAAWVLVAIGVLFAFSGPLIPRPKPAKKA